MRCPVSRSKIISTIKSNRFILTTLLIALAGSGLLFVINAASSSSSVEPERGTISPPASQISDATASGENAIMFGNTVTAGTDFNVIGSKIFDPQGKEFIPVGANVNGPNSWWNGYTAGNASIAKDRWHWNVIRLNTCYDNTPCPHTGNTISTVNNNLDAIVNDYTSKKIVVQIVLFQYTGGFPEGSELTKATNWWVNIANKHRNNPYVWFNLLNEPGDQPSTIPQWNSVTDTLSTAIRNTGAKNIIVADGTSWGQEVYRGWDCITSINPADSGILSKGSDLAVKHKNMIFNVHVYDWWGGGNCPDSTRDQLISWYFGQTKSRNISVHVGELQGASNLQYDYKPGTTAAARAFFRKAPELRIGLLYWHGNGGSTWTSDLVDVSNPEWYKINSTASNLTEWGTLLRNYSLLVNP